MVEGVGAVLAGPGRAADHAAEILGPEPGVLVDEHIGFDIAEGRLGLVANAVVEGLDDLFFEAVGTRMRVDNRLTLGIREFGKSDAEHLHLAAGSDARNAGRSVLWIAGCGVMRNRRPHSIDVLLCDAGAPEKVSRGVGSVYFEALMLARVL